MLVRQFRPAVYASLLREQGQPPALEACFGHELCAGLIDKDKSLEEIVSEEVRRLQCACRDVVVQGGLTAPVCQVAEECGFSVPASAMQKVVSYTGSQHKHCLGSQLAGPAPDPGACRRHWHPGPEEHHVLCR